MPDLDLFDPSSLSELSSDDDDPMTNDNDDDLPGIKSIRKQKKKGSKKKQQQRQETLPAFDEPTVKDRNASPTPEIAASQTPSIPPILDISRGPSIKQETPPLETRALKVETLSDIPTTFVQAQAITSTAPTTTNGTTTTTIAPSTSQNQQLSAQDEWSLLQRLEHSSKKLPFSACRYKRKLAVRRLKRNLGIKLFDMDTQIIQLLRTPKHVLEPISKETTIQPASNQQQQAQEQNQYDDLQQSYLDKIIFTPYTSSFASRLFGSIRQRGTMTREEPWLSSWNGRKLRPFIRRDYTSKPKRMLMMGQIKACQGKPYKKSQAQADGVIPGESIDYVYFQKEHLGQVNNLLKRSFWEGIDVSESLLFPEFSIVALYKRHVIGCAFMTPEAYITYFAVDAGWGNASIGQ